MANKVIKRKKINPYLSGGNNYFNFGSFMSNLAGNPLDGKLTTGLFKGMDSGVATAMPSLGATVGKIGGSLIGGGLLSGAGKALSGLSNVASMIPGPIGTFGSAALGIASGVANRLVGIKEDAEAKAHNALTIANNLNTVKAAASADSFDSEGLQRTASTFKNVYKGGLLSGGKANSMNARERDNFIDSNLLADRAISNSVANIAKNQADEAQRSFVMAYGGPLGSLDYLLASDYNNALNALSQQYTTDYNRLLLPKVTKELPKFSFGGELNTNGADFTNGLIFINNGGTHEANPLEGVPMGVDQEGTPNLVEEGEVIVKSTPGKDYVLSDRINVPKAVRRKYKLREGGPLTFAAAAKKLSRESEERPNDPISQNGLLDNLMMLMETLEKIRLDKQAKQYTKGRRLFKGGGPKYNYEWYARQAKMLGMADDDLSDFKGSFTDIDKDNLAAFNTLANTWIENRRYNDWLNTQKQSMFNLDLTNKAIYRAGNSDNYYKAYSWDAPVLGWVSSDWKYNPNNPTNGILSLEDYNNLSNDARSNYKPLDYKAGDFVKDINTGNIVYDNLAFTADQIKAGYNPTGYEADTKDKIDIQFPQNKGYNPLTSLRYIPALGAGIGAFSDLMGWTNKPDYTPVDTILNSASLLNNKEVSATPLGDYLAYTPFDKNYYINQLNALSGATKKSLANISGGNRGATMAGLLAADYNYLNNLGSLARQAEEYNLGQREKIASFNRDTNKFNSEMLLKADMANQAMRNSNRELALKGVLAAADLRQKIDAQSSTAKSANLTNLFNSLGNIGREEVMKSWINESPALLYNISTRGNGAIYGANGGYLTVRKRKKR